MVSAAAVVILGVVVPAATHNPRSELRGFLSIDKLALDECLMEQPELYDRVAEAVANAEAERDSAQLSFEELVAEFDKQQREKAQKGDKRVTDKAIEAQIKGLPKVQTAHRELLEKKRDAKLWRALEKAFEQRADMLGKLVALHLRSTYGYSLEAGVGQARGQMAEGSKAAVGAFRRQRRV